MIVQTLKHDIVTQTVRDWISSGRYDHGSCLPTNMELARIFGFNHQTISRGLQPLVNEGILERSPRRGTIVCGTVGKPASNAVVLVTPSHGDVYEDTVRQTDQILGSYGLFPLIVDSAILDSSQDIANFLNRIRSMQQPFGYLVEGTTFYPYQLIRDSPGTYANTIFTFCYHDQYEIPSCRYVLSDMHFLGRQAADWFAAKGARRIVFPALYEKDYSGPWSSLQVQVMNGLAERCDELGLSFDRALFWRLHGGAPMREMLHDCFLSPKAPDAVFAWSDSKALTILQHLSDFGIHYPDDYLLMGTYNTPQSTAYSFPSMDMRMPEIMKTAIGMLENEIPEQKIYIKPTLVEHP